MGESEHLPLADAAKYLGVSRAKLSRLAAQGIIPFSRSVLDNRVKLFSRADLDEIRARPVARARPEFGPQ